MNIAKSHWTKKIQKQFYIDIFVGSATRAYRFLNGIFGSKDMPATFQKTIYKTLESINSKLTFPDDILICTKRTLSEHQKELDKILNLLDKKSLARDLQQCDFAKTTHDWDNKENQELHLPQQKIEMLFQLEPPKTLKQFRSFMGCIHHLIKLIPSLETLSKPLSLLFSEANTRAQNKIEWETEHIAFQKIKMK